MTDFLGNTSNEVMNHRWVIEVMNLLPKFWVTEVI